MSDDDIDAVIDTNLVGCSAGRPPRGQGHGPPAPRPAHLRLERRRACWARPARRTTPRPRPAWSALARSLARELGSRGITANVVAPGFVDTDMTAVLGEERRAEILGAVPARAATPRPTRSRASSSSSPSDAAAYITGAVVPVDGGLGMGH